jgi:phosphatidylglycerophosphate synthase
MLKTKYPASIKKISRRIGKFFSKIPVNPNTWTILSIIPGVLGFFVLIYHQMFLGFILFFISGFFDAIDGGVARVTKKVTKLGGYLDGIIDRIIEGLLMIGLLLFGLPDIVLFGYTTPAYLWISLQLFFGSVFVSFARAYADHKKIIRDEKMLSKMPGILERTERLFLIGFGMLVYYVQPIYTTYVIFIAVILSTITFLQRVYFVVNYGAKK